MVLLLGRCSWAGPYEALITTIISDNNLKKDIRNYVRWGGMGRAGEPSGAGDLAAH